MHIAPWPTFISQAQCGKERNCKISFENSRMRSHTHCACCWTEHINLQQVQVVGGGGGLHIQHVGPIKKVHVVTLTNNLADAFGHLAKAKASTFSIFMACLSLPGHVFSSTRSIPHNSYMIYIYIF